jgi:Dyp-type peroxidase family
MKRQAESDRPFNDPPADQWMQAFQGRPDAVIILAHDDPAELSQAVTDLRQELTPITTAIWSEEGTRLTFDFPGRVEPVTIEHFGFEDGISNPLFYLDDIEQERAWRGATKWDPAAPLKLALTVEPNYPDRYGSFFVFRKLEQNVAGFKQALVELANQLGPGDPERAGAMAVGRFRDGTSIVPAPAPDPAHGQTDFYFKTDDAVGGTCPFHAHIRKTNPRGDTGLTLEGERMFRVVRRGITYGVRPDLETGSALPPPSADVGLLFMCYQAGLAQFAIQQEGSDSNDFVNEGVGVDAVIGQNAAPSPQEWPTGSGRRFTIANFVKMLGGEYFFAPSLAFLRTLDQPM